MSEHNTSLREQLREDDTIDHKHMKYISGKLCALTQA